MKQASEATGLADLRIGEAPKTLRALALERLRSAILDFHFRPGERLVERKLCARLGVSRSVVREVIRHLESEGLVEAVPNRGPIVAGLDPASAAEIYEIRAMLEAAAAHACAARADKAAIARLAGALRDIEAGYQAKDRRAVLAATTRFYETVFLTGGKRVSWEMVQRLNGRIGRLRAMTIGSKGRARSGPAQMRRIYAAIRAREPERAAAACREHVARAAEIARHLLDGRAEASSPDIVGIGPAR